MVGAVVVLQHRARRTERNLHKDRDIATVLITGTSAGIGFATAVAFARAGHTVAAAMRNPQQAPELAAIAAAEKLKLAVFTMNVDDNSSVADGVRQVVQVFGPIDVLVNNAGIERVGAIEEVPLSAFREVMETNYFGVIRCVQAVLPAMREQRRGCIVNVTSISGRLASSPMGPYAASKFALEALSECLAQEVKPFNVRVAIIEPGIIQTKMAARISEVPTASRYPHQDRMAALFRVSLSQPTPPTLVAEKVLEVVESGTWVLRHPVGPDAAPFIGWRQSMTDEDWVSWGALDDDAWYARVKADFGIDARDGAPQS